MDLLIVYSEDSAPDAILAAAQQAAESGKSVRVQRAGDTAIRACEMMTV